MNEGRFTVRIPAEEVADLKRRLAATRWPDDPDNGDWRFGVEREWLRDMVGWWAERFDWREIEAELNAFDHRRVSIDDVPIHFVHVPGRGPDPMPLLLSHGWPWTFWDWKRVIGPLTDPAAHGGDPADAFDLIIPSLPGFGFSTPLRRTGIGVRAIGRIWLKLMRDHLRHDHFIAAGGDWGSLVSAELGHAYPEHVRGVHLTLPILPGVGPQTVKAGDYAPDERWMADRVAEARSVSRSHLEVHRRSPQTLGYALEDSPAGLAAWIWERRRNWSDCGGEIERVFDRDFLCATASLYWFTRSAGSAMRLYAAQAEQGWDPLHERSRLIDVPTAFAVAPKELFLLPRRIAEQRTNLTRWTRFPSGGHFLPMEAPELLVEEYRAFARPLR
jgi:pimeloyl-ACP methyl ester carboxylesterase